MMERLDFFDEAGGGPPVGGAQRCAGSLRRVYAPCRHPRVGAV